MRAFLDNSRMVRLADSSGKYLAAAIKIKESAQPTGYSSPAPEWPTNIRYRPHGAERIFFADSCAQSPCTSIVPASSVRWRGAVGGYAGKNTRRPETGRSLNGAPRRVPRDGKYGHGVMIEPYYLRVLLRPDGHGTDPSTVRRIRTPGAATGLWTPARGAKRTISR